MFQNRQKVNVQPAQSKIIFKLAEHLQQLVSNTCLNDEALRIHLKELKQQYIADSSTEPEE